MLDWAYRMAPGHGQGWLLLGAAWLARRGHGWMVRAGRPPLGGRGGGVTAVLIRLPANPADAHALVRRKLNLWPAVGTRLYVACPIMSPAMLGAVAATGGDPRLRIVVIDIPGLPGRADCLDRLYAALEEDERRGGFRARMIVLDDAGEPAAC